MFPNKFRAYARLSAPDEKRLVVSRRDFSGGENTRQHPSKINPNQLEVLENFDIGVPGQVTKIPGTSLIEDLGSNAGTGAFGFTPRLGTNELLVTEGVNLRGYTGSGTFTTHNSGFTTGLSTTMIKATCSGANGDVVLISNGTDNVRQMLQDHTVTDLGTGNTDCPLTKVLTFFRNRVWALKANLLYWSDALPSTYDNVFDRTANNYNITVGEERALLGLRDLGLICLGADAVYGINPSVTPTATDKPEKILDIGCVAGNTAQIVGDDVYFLANDGVRGVFRTQQDKLQLGQTFPLSYPLKTEFDTINWSVISKACAVYFDNKYFLALPTSASSYNNRVWVYYPAIQSWMVITGWNVGAWGKVTFAGQEKLYYIDANDGTVNQAWTGTTNSGSAIDGVLVSREEDCDSALQFKSGGEVEIEAQTAGNNSALTVSVAVDGGSFTVLGTVDLSSTGSPTLPIALPFALADQFIVRQKLHLDSIGRWKTLQIMIENDEANTDPIVISAYNIISFVEEYMNE